MLKSGLEVIKPTHDNEFWCWPKDDFRENGALITVGFFEECNPLEAAKHFACVQRWTEDDTPAVIRILTYKGEIYEVTVGARSVFTGSDCKRRWPKGKR